jgi:hypothetical protein
MKAPIAQPAALPGNAQDCAIGAAFMAKYVLK